MFTTKFLWPIGSVKRRFGVSGECCDGMLNVVIELTVSFSDTDDVDDGEQLNRSLAFFMEEPNESLLLRRLWSDFGALENLKYLEESNWKKILYSKKMIKQIPDSYPILLKSTPALHFGYQEARERILSDRSRLFCRILLMSFSSKMNQSCLIHSATTTLTCWKTNRGCFCVLILTCIYMKVSTKRLRKSISSMSLLCSELFPNKNIPQLQHFSQKKKAAVILTRLSTKFLIDVKGFRGKRTQPLLLLKKWKRLMENKM